MINPKFNENKIHIFTDGNCKQNGKVYAKGGYGVFITDDPNSIYSSFNCVGRIVGKQTNQTSELTAINKALNIICDNPELFKSVEICTDSSYSINCLTVWYRNWNRNGWMTSNKKPVKNASIIKNNLELMAKINVLKIGLTFKHVKAHQCSPPDQESFNYFLWYGNNTVDNMINKIL